MRGVWPGDGILNSRYGEKKVENKREYRRENETVIVRVGRWTVRGI